MRAVGGCVFGAFGEVDVGVGERLAVEADGGVLRVGTAYGDGAGDGAVGDGLAADVDGAFGGGVGCDGGGGVRRAVAVVRRVFLRAFPVRSRWR